MRGTNKDNGGCPSAPLASLLLIDYQRRATNLYRPSYTPDQMDQWQRFLDWRTAWVKECLRYMPGWVREKYHDLNEVQLHAGPAASSVP